MAVSTYSLGRLDQDVQHTVWVFFDPICADRVVGINTVGRSELSGVPVSNLSQRSTVGAMQQVYLGTWSQ